MKNIRVFFLSENFQFLEMKFSIYLNRHVFVMPVFMQEKKALLDSSYAKASLGSHFMLGKTQRAHDVYTTSAQRRCNIENVHNTG